MANSAATPSKSSKKSSPPQLGSDSEPFPSPSGHADDSSSSAPTPEPAAPPPSRSSPEESPLPSSKRPLSPPPSPFAKEEASKASESSESGLGYGNSSWRPSSPDSPPPSPPPLQSSQRPSPAPSANSRASGKSSPPAPSPPNSSSDSGNSHQSPPREVTSPPPAPAPQVAKVTPPSPPAPQVANETPTRQPVGQATPLNAPPSQVPNAAPSYGQVPPPKLSSPGSQSTPYAPSTSHSSPKNSSLKQSPGGEQDDHSITSPGTVVGIAVASVFVIVAITLFFLLRRRRKTKRRAEGYANHQYLPPADFSVKADGYYYTGHSGPPDSQQQTSMQANHGSQRHMHAVGTPESGVLGCSKAFFTYEELMEITNGFSRQNVIGEGGFGCVYQGFLPDGKVVAVKQLKAGGGQGDREFRAEVEIISRVHHRHLVSLVGYCISDQHRLLIYDFVPNKTLEHHLHGKGMPVLDWVKRLKIAVGSAKGLAYLHEDCYPKIIHRDIKSANILLDDAFEAQVADFGLARLNDTSQTHVSTRVMGTFGYLAPEYATSGKLTDRSDVFSFGVVLLELITGRKPVDSNQPLGEESLVEWARPLLIHAIETGEISEVVDPRLGKQYVESEMFRMIETAAACVRHSAPKRPRMMQVVRALDSEAEMSDLSNGVKVGQSIAYDSGQYSKDIERFRRMAFSSGESMEYDMCSREYASKEVASGLQSAQRSQTSSSEFSNNGSETRALNSSSGEQRYTGSQVNYGRHQF